MARWGGAEERELDSRNQIRSLNLVGKVSQLKSIAVDLEQESYEHNRILNGIDDDFNSGDSFLMGSMNRLKGVLNAGGKNRKAMCYTSLIVIAIFVFIFYFLSSTGSGG